MRRLYREKRFKNIQEMRVAFEMCFKEDIPGKEKPNLDELIDKETIKLKPIPKEGIRDYNGFVTYLNTLHNVTPNNSNTLAESQAVNKYFGPIHVKLDLTKFIIEKLTAADGNHVILTGHAGDGKSTIGLELYKQLKRVPILKKLESLLKEREEIKLPNNNIIYLVKDMSELSEQDRLKEILSACDERLNKNKKLIIEPAHKLKIDQNKLQNCRSNILNLVNVL
ncbi:hypothetical protein D1AOALGA4SA_2826 [Olavius algarvensis Delta 1 endosymbiont]|nr:hypothetical protein D1AOALGA4SA_2826 [Olavius algarvensis Delta 1 endosymbiont]